MLKISVYIFAISLMMALWSCNEPPVIFTEPQPAGLLPDKFISPIYRGTFYCETDSSVVHVHAKTIFKERYYKIQSTIEDLEGMEGVEVRNGKIQIKGWQDIEIKEMRGDSIFTDFIMSDTLFHLGPKQVLKSFKGHYIMSKQLNRNDWEVNILSLDYDLNLRLSKTVLPEDVEQLEAITPVEDISTESKIQFRISPTMMEFDQILKQKLIFEECDYFTRIHMLIQI